MGIPAAYERGNYPQRVVLPGGISEPIGGSAFTVKVPNAGNRLSLTFDEHLDGNTVDLVKAMTAAKMRCTVFAVGEEVARRPGLVRRLLKHGHEVGNHSFDHARSAPGGLITNVPNPRKNLAACQDAIYEAARFRPGLYRPPSGATNATVNAAAHDLGLKVCNWSGGGADIFSADPATIASATITACQPGAIVLLHQGAPTIAALPMIFAYLKAQGLRSIPVTELLGGRLVPAPPT